jgi:hypothetical protein
MEAVERAIRAAVTGLGGRLLEGLLAADAGHRGAHVDCGAGHQAEFVSYRAKTIATVLGPVRFRRAWYHCRRCGHGLAPGDGQLGVAGASMSPGLRKMTARAAAAVPFAGAAALLRELAGVELTAKRAERSAETDGQAAAALIAGQASAILARRIVSLPPADPPDKLYLAIDGTGVPMVAAETEGRPGKHDDGRARTREVKMACLFTQTTTDADGWPVRDPGSASYLATFGNAARLGDLAEAEARRRGSEHVRQVTILGDGAAWIWNQASQHFPAATQIVDLYHAREHLHELGSLVAFMLGTGYPGWLTERLAELDRGDIPALIASFRALPLASRKARERDKALHYFQVNAHRMHYAWYRSLGLFVGSGMVEAGCKSVIGARLKQSGMHWTEAGATGILTLRCQQASGRWDEIWPQANNQIPQPGPVTTAA